MHTPQEKQKGLAREAQSIVSNGLPATPLSRQNDNIANPDGHVWLRSKLPVRMWAETVLVVAL